MGRNLVLTDAVRTVHRCGDEILSMRQEIPYVMRGKSSLHGIKLVPTETENASLFEVGQEPAGPPLNLRLAGVSNPSLSAVGQLAAGLVGATRLVRGQVPPASGLPLQRSFPNFGSAKRLYGRYLRGSVLGYFQVGFHPLSELRERVRLPYAGS